MSGCLACLVSDRQYPGLAGLHWPGGCSLGPGDRRCGGGLTDGSSRVSISRRSPSQRQKARLMPGLLVVSSPCGCLVGAGQPLEVGGEPGHVEVCDQVVVGLEDGAAAPEESGTVATAAPGAGVCSPQARRAARITRIADTAVSVLLPLIRGLTIPPPGLPMLFSAGLAPGLIWYVHRSSITFPGFCVKSSSHRV